MPPPMTPAPRTPTRAIFRGLTPAPGPERLDARLLLDLFHPEEEADEAPHDGRADERSDPFDLELERLRERLRRSPSRRRRAPRAAPDSGPSSPSGRPGAPSRRRCPCPGPSRSFSVSFGSRTRAGPPPGPAFERFFVPNFPRANVFAQSSRIASGTTSSTRPILFARFAVEDLAREDDVEGVREADHPREARRAAPGRQDAELDLRKADLRLRRVGREPPVHRERRLAAAAHAGAVDRGDRRDTAGSRAC